jgi:RNA polymerase sigma factor (sigma-70 family)
VEETLIRAVDRLGDLRDPSAFRSWLAAIAMRQVRDRWRARQSRPVPYGAAFEASFEASFEAADPGADFVDLTILRLELSDQRRETALATRWLDTDDRELPALWWLEAAGELSRADLAGALGLKAGHVSVRVQRLKQQLETARVVVRALAAIPQCAELSELARGWDGRPSSVWRRRFARHTRDCVMCAAHWQGLVPSEKLLAGLALVPVPTLLAVKVTAMTAAPIATAASLATGAPTEAHAAMRMRPHGAKHGVRSAKFSTSASAKAVAVGAARAVAAGAGVVHAALGAPSRLRQRVRRNRVGRL